MKTQKVLGKDHETLSRDFLIQLQSNFNSVLLDIGAGDGKGSLRFARKYPEVLVIAIDSSFDALEKTSTTSRKKPSRGGVNNMLCLYGNIKNSADDLIEIADVVRILLPWGDLLEGIATLDEEMLCAISKCVKPGAKIEIVINAEIWKTNLPKSLEYLGEITPDFFTSNSEIFKKAEIEILESYEIPLKEIEELDTTWTNKLMSSRKSASFIMAKGVRS